MDIKEAYIKAYGPIPDDATCHIGRQIAGGTHICPTIRYKSMNGEIMWASPELLDTVYTWVAYRGDYAWGPDISDRDAVEFVEFFDNRFDEIVVDDWRSSLRSWDGDCESR